MATSPPTFYWIIRAAVNNRRRQLNILFSFNHRLLRYNARREKTVSGQIFEYVMVIRSFVLCNHWRNQMKAISIAAIICAVDDNVCGALGVEELAIDCGTL